MAGKGDDPRPFSVPRSEYERKWDSINWKPKADKPKDNKNKKPK